MLLARMDGGCFKNPGGPGAAACTISRNGVELYRISILLPKHPKMTNNIAEFAAMKLILEWCKMHQGSERVHVIADSQIVINRLSGRALKPPVGSCAQLARECVNLRRELKSPITFEWSRRSNNTDCDKMCSEKIRQYMKSSKAAPARTDNSFVYGEESI